MMIEIQKKHRKSPQKYDGYRALFKDVGGTELLARLATAEVVSARCAKRNDSLLRAIIGTLLNRMKTLSKRGEDIVYQRDQFASSMNLYRHSAYSVFLCPTAQHRSLYFQAYEVVSSMAGGEIPNPLPPTSVNYYLHRHFGDYKANPTTWSHWPTTLEIGRCASFYRPPLP